MIAPPSFHLATTPLATGVCLVEASAGTGKTFTIAGLFLRLILERDLSVREILVVTFTEAATEELRERIRRTLVDAMRVLDGCAAENPAVAEIVARASHRYGVAATVRSREVDAEACAAESFSFALENPAFDLAVAATPNTARPEACPAPATLRWRLERALRAFDEAPICTIHSFCQRALRDHAFESGALFDTDLVTDDSDLLQSVADDYWRRRFYEADPLLVSAALHGRLSPEALVRWLCLHNRHPSLRVISGVDGRSLDDLARELHEAFAAARAQWRAHHGEIRALFTPSAPWAKGDYGKPDEVAAWLEDLDRCFADGCPTPEALANLKQFTPDDLQKNTRAKKQAPEHAFFKCCGELSAAVANYLIGLRLDFPSVAQDALRRRKQELKVQSYDDLLTGLMWALRGDSGPALIAEVRRKFRAALIDEFQDTDPVQWEVFRTIFAPRRMAEQPPHPGPLPLGGGEGGAGGSNQTSERQLASDSSALSPRRTRGEVRGEGSPPNAQVQSSAQAPQAWTPSLFLIGDPKQAIYGFRGADLFTYLDAARAAQDRYTLDRNWRSESGLVGAVNTLFGAAPNPFAFDEIAFQKVNPAGNADEAPLRENGTQSPPLRLWLLSREADQKAISKEFAEDKLPGVVAAEIVRLLNGSTTLGMRRLTPRDIAVLVPENRQAALMQEALRHVGVPSVLHTEESVFASREARELERVLAALAQPGHERALRVALATDLMGLGGSELDSMAGDEAAWQSWRETARTHHDRWLELGFMPMFRHWLHVGQVRRRFLSFEDGERRLTNLLHLAEALHAAAQEHRFGPAPLARWLAEQISASDRASEEHQLRLERDDEAVRLVTIHKSKGLEYPIVFCPFSWKSSEPKRSGEEQVLFHWSASLGSPCRGSVPPHPGPLPLGGGEGGAAGSSQTFDRQLASDSSSLSPRLTRGEGRGEGSLPAQPPHPSPLPLGGGEGGDGRLSQFVLDLGSSEYDAHRRLAFREKLAENLRLLYVALTRAKNRCYFVWGAFRGAGTSAAAWLLHRPLELGEDWQSAMTEHFKSLDDAALHADLLRLVKSSAINGLPTIRVERLPEAASERFRPQAVERVELQPRRFTGVIPTNWRIASFSGLVAASADELPDHDSESRTATPAPHLFGVAATVRSQADSSSANENDAAAQPSAAPSRDLTVAATQNISPVPEPGEAKGIFAFPRGTRAGTCLHQIFEELEFTQTDDAELRRLVESKLRLHGIPGDEFAPAVFDAVRRALRTPLDSARQDFTLSRVPRTERLTELEFFLPVRELTPALLRHGLAASGEDVATRLGALGFKPAGGFLKGFIDLVFRFEGRFYIVDWKSNWLGPRVEDYGPAAMRAEMARRFYALQAHLYVVALHEYLRLRLPGYHYDEHIGGVRYIFLRGLDPARPELGVFRDRPEAETIKALAKSLRDGERAGAAALAIEHAR